MPDTEVMKSTPSYIGKIIPGTFYRVSPQTSAEILALQTLEIHREKFSPASGDGVIVSPEALMQFT